MPPGPRPNLFMDATPPLRFFGDPVLGRARGSGVHPDSQFWTLRRVGGTPQQPWYQVINRGTGGCLYWSGITGAEGRGPHPISVDVGGGACRTQGFRLVWWQFRTLTNQPVNPGLSSITNKLRLHWYGQGDEAAGLLCLTVPFSQFRVGIRLAAGACSQAVNQQWWIYRSDIPGT